MTAAEKIAALRATHEAATEGPWMYGTPDDDCEQTRAEWMAECAKEPDGSAAGSLWVAWQQRDGELLIPAITGDGPTSEHNAAAIVSAHNNLPALLTALEDVLAIHRPVTIYDECDCTDEQKEIGHEDIYEVGRTCNALYVICGECCRDDIYQTEDCANNHPRGLCHPCPTVAAIEAALAEVDHG